MADCVPGPGAQRLEAGRGWLPAPPPQGGFSACCPRSHLSPTSSFPTARPESWRWGASGPLGGHWGVSATMRQKGGERS